MRGRLTSDEKLAPRLLQTPVLSYCNPGCGVRACCIWHCRPPAAPGWWLSASLLSAFRFRLRPGLSSFVRGAPFGRPFGRPFGALFLRRCGLALRRRCSLSVCLSPFALGVSFRLLFPSSVWRSASSVVSPFGFPFRSSFPLRAGVCLLRPCAPFRPCFRPFLLPSYLDAPAGVWAVGSGSALLAVSALPVRIWLVGSRRARSRLCLGSGFRGVVARLRVRWSVRPSARPGLAASRSRLSPGSSGSAWVGLGLASLRSARRWFGRASVGSWVPLMGGAPRRFCRYPIAAGIYSDIISIRAILIIKHNTIATALRDEKPYRRSSLGT